MPPTGSTGQFMAKVDHYNRTKQINFLMGPSVKLVLPIIDSISEKKVIFSLSQSKTQQGGQREFCLEDTNFTQKQGETDSRNSWIALSSVECFAGQRYPQFELHPLL